MQHLPIRIVALKDIPHFPIITPFFLFPWFATSPDSMTPSFLVPRNLPLNGYVYVALRKMDPR